MCNTHNHKQQSIQTFKPWIILLFFSLTSTAFSQEIRVLPGSLQQAITSAKIGDHLILQSGTHLGPITIDQPLTLTGEKNTVLQGDGKTSVITVNATDVTIQNLHIVHSGIQLATFDSGIMVMKAASRVRIKNNTFKNNLFGVYLRGADDPWVLNNQIEGKEENLRMSERGDGISIWNTKGARIEDNQIQHVRDGIFINISHKNTLKNNHFTHLRFAIHYMYSHDNEISGNTSIGNDIGFALMFSNRLKIFDNVSKGDQHNGLMFNYTNHSQVWNNVIENVEKKGIFIYNSSSNTIHDNQLKGCGIGIHFTGGSENNHFFGNSFIGNRTQVKYVGTKYHEWSHKNRGNFWSDNSSFDLNSDGIADVAYRPNDLIDQVMWQYPLAKLLLTSPSIQTLRLAQSRFPALLPGGVTDSFPMMYPTRFPKNETPTLTMKP